MSTGLSTRKLAPASTRAAAPWTHPFKVGDNYAMGGTYMRVKRVGSKFVTFEILPGKKETGL